MTVETLETHRCFGGTVSICRHQSAATGTPMRFSIFVPEGKGPFPAVTFLAGLTCTEENFTFKAGAYGKAAQLGLALIAPDTSPRGNGVADDPAYDLGQGAGFYIDATEKPWAPHFCMETYIARDLPAALRDNFPVDGERQSITGHSMGGHGALTLALKYPDRYRSVSAFAPIVSPTRCPWGEKAFTAYLGADRSAWAAHDASALMTSGSAVGHFEDILIDQGLADNFLEEQLKPELFEDACATHGQKLTLRRHAGYDHSYYFIQTFIGDHLEFHARHLS
ncbi:S-formylglutathione hydrolase [Parvibaculum sp.]|uniref:S-formylglutathione hydrolase n=1 Tax=Parvibaculum sp. TaxID=2024848 RepID=UPI0027252052|nr:S-formylglutathione hydrolase [Parvibaculum sp.]MDO9126808.1 S-formylglutathione hydrolase [Parvibaculum sp.]MDP1627007.1 S-formylglutathione hydrolase [Parvibaculum sp.]MDP2149801.1 S-formylglutathione hydrolase [Parvibaculum sp.]MDP3327245.1 S-formylglutathione hydrolase [Parvibaculum sp.]